MAIRSQAWATGEKASQLRYKRRYEHSQYMHDTWCHTSSYFIIIIFRHGHSSLSPSRIEHRYLPHFTSLRGRRMFCVDRRWWYIRDGMVDVVWCATAVFSHEGYIDGTRRCRHAVLREARRLLTATYHKRWLGYEEGWCCCYGMGHMYGDTATRPRRHRLTRHSVIDRFTGVMPPAVEEQHRRWSMLPEDYNELLHKITDDRFVTSHRQYIRYDILR